MVKSSPPITTLRPSIRPVPATKLAAMKLFSSPAPSYSALPASAPISRNEPSSSRTAIRSRTVSRPASCCRRILSGPPMRWASSCRRRSSSSSGCQVIPTKANSVWHLQTMGNRRRHVTVQRELTVARQPCIGHPARPPFGESHGKQTRHQVSRTPNHPDRALGRHPCELLGLSRRVVDRLCSGGRPDYAASLGQERVEPSGYQPVATLARVQPVDCPHVRVVHRGVVGSVEMQRPEPLGHLVDDVVHLVRSAGKWPGPP